MWRQLYEALEFIGARVVWDALAAIGSLAAVFAALWLADRQGREQRRRDAAQVKALMVIIVPATDALRSLIQTYDSLRKARAETNRLRAESVTGEVVAEAQARQFDLYDANRVAAEAALKVLGRCFKRLLEVDILVLPSSICVSAVESAILALEDRLASVQQMVGGDDTRLEVRDLYDRLTAILLSLTGLAQHYGSGAGTDDAKVLHGWMTSRTLRLRRLLRNREAYRSLFSARRQVRRQRAEHEERERRLEELRSRVLGGL